MGENPSMQSPEPTPLNSVQNQTSHTTTIPLPPRTAATAAVVGNNNNIKKRKRSNVVDIRNSAYFKILALIQLLRPHFIEALQAPDLSNSKAAYEIRKRMKLVMDLYKQIQVEGNPVRNTKNGSSCQPSPGKKKFKKETKNDDCQGGTKLECLEPNALKQSPCEEFVQGLVSSVEDCNDSRPQGSYIVGGSAIDRNFITFVNRKPPAYYGVTKESYRCCHSKSEKDDSKLGISDRSDDQKSL